MTYQETAVRMKGLDEEHLLRCYKDLSPEGQAALLAQLERLDFSCAEEFLSRREEIMQGMSPLPAGETEPVDAMELPEIKARGAALRERGLAASKRGELAAVLMAGGAGTRLGSDGPKGAYDIGVTRPVYIFQRLLENLGAEAALAGRPFHLFIMTSESNRKESERFLIEHDFFGYPRDYVRFFNQEMAPCLTDEGRAFLDAPDHVASSPNGNGGWFPSLRRAGLVDFMHREGIKYLNVFAVDNVLQRICDPVFFGALLEGDFDSGAKVVRKTGPDEKLGLLCRREGRTEVVEYSEMTEEMRNAKRADGSFLYSFGMSGNYLFRLEALERAAGAAMPLHFAHKAVPFMDEAGRMVHPGKPNAWKAEYFIFDILRELDSFLPFEVERWREFAPVKNRTGIDSVETARELLAKNGIEI